MSESSLYQDEDWLRRQYWEKEMSLAEIADECGCCADTVHRWMNKHDIERRETSVANSISHGGKHKRYRDEEWLREKYVSEELSIVDIGEQCDCDPTTILKWLQRFDIETRSSEGRDNYAWTEYCGYTHKEGWPQWHIGRYTEYSGQFYPVHRLLAVAEFGTDAVARAEVHHKKGIRWDNRPENLELLDSVTHARRQSGDGQSLKTAECDLCGDSVQLRRAVPNPRDQPVHRDCYVEAYGGPEWLKD